MMIIEDDMSITMKEDIGKEIQAHYPLADKASKLRGKVTKRKRNQSEVKLGGDILNLPEMLTMIGCDLVTRHISYNTNNQSNIFR